MVLDSTLQLTFEELLLDEFWCSSRDFPKLSIRLLKYFPNYLCEAEFYSGTSTKTTYWSRLKP